MKNKSFTSLKYLLLVYLLVTVVYPLVSLFSTIGGEDISTVLRAAQFMPMLTNSVITTLLATVISVLLAFVLAYILNRSRIRFKQMFIVLFTIPMLIPSISHGMGLVLLFGDNGLLTNLLGVNINLYGYTGIVIGSVLYSFPVAFLMFNDTLQYEDYTVYEAAQVLGLSKFQQFLTITLPTLRRTIISAVLAVFTMVFTDYGVPLMTGGTVMTLPVYMYREVIGQMDFSRGAVVGIVLLLPAVAAFLMDLRNSTTDTSSSTITKPFNVPVNQRRDILVYGVFALFVVLLCLPIASFTRLGFVKLYPIDMSFSFDQVQKLLTNNLRLYFVNSMAIALLTALVGTCLAFFSAFVTARSQRKAPEKVLHFISMLSLAIPGVVLGLAFVLSFNKLPIYGTVFILVLVNIVHFFSSPYLLAYNSLTKYNPNLEDVAQSLGISKMRMLLDVYVPCTVTTILEMYSYFFVNGLITISAVSFLINFRTTPLSLLIPQLESQSFVEGTALVSLLILMINLVEKSIVFLIKRSLFMKEVRRTAALSEENT